jgi:integrase
MARSRERGTGSVYLKEDPNNPGQKLRTWWISYYVDGKRKRESSKSRKKSDAQALLKRRMGEHALGLEIGDEEKRLTFEDLEAGFRRSYENSGRRSLRRAGNAWDRLRDNFGNWKARAISANALETYAAERLKEAAPATVQYELAVLRRAMSLAVKKGQLRSRPHFPHVGVHNARTGFFTRDEMEKIATEIGPELGNLVRVAFWTGWRRGELLTLKWADVDWEAGVLRLRPTSTIAGTTTKNNEGRVFPFRRLLPLEDALRAQRAYTDDVARRTGTIPQYVFHRDGKQIGHFRRAWASACERAGVKLSRDRVFHSLRASAARNLTAAGVPEHVAMRLMGHKTRIMFERYSITTEGDLHEAVGRLAGGAPDAGVVPLKAAAPADQQTVKFRAEG